MYTIETFDLTKRYMSPGKLASLIMRSPIKTDVLAVDRVNLQVKSGELFGLIGPNGAGKTTLVKMLCTLLWPTSGTAVIGGRDIKDNENQVKAMIGFVSGEERSFYWRLTGRQNLRFFASLGNLFAKNGEEKIDEVLERLELKESADNMVYSYSSGMKQRLAIARGLLSNPSILFLDEPTKSLDPVTARSLKHFIKGELVQTERRTVFLTSHRLEEIETLCDRFAILNKGKITFSGTVADLRKSLRLEEHYTLKLKGLAQSDVHKVVNRSCLRQVTIDYNGEPEVAVINFTFPNGTDLLAKLIGDVTTLGATVLSCQREELKLEDLFVEHLSRSVAK